MTMHTAAGPRSEHDRALVDHVRPPGWQNPEPASRYNLVVVGGGTAGLVSAAAAAILGARVALVERDRLGGDCLNTGCVPSKGLIRAARAAASARHGGPFGVTHAAAPGFDFARAAERMRRVRAEISAHDSAERFRRLGVDVFFGEARFTGPGTVTVDDDTLRFKKAVIATGARASVPPIPGLETAGYLTNETVFDLTDLPARLLIVGGGPIGIELAQAFARFGSRVTVAEILPRFLAMEDPDAAAVLAGSLTRDGVDVRLATTVKEVAAADEGKLAVLEHGGRAETLVVDEILIGAGRSPNVDGLGLDAAGVAHDAKRGVVVDDFLRSTNRRIFAAGDVCLRHKFTHTADAAARIVIQNALFPGRKRVSSLTVPWCTYTSPEIAHVGMYPRDADERGIRVDTYEVQFDDVDRTMLEGDTDGFVKIHVRAGSDKILGATIVGEHAGELISEITLAMVAGVGLGTIASVIHPYPTRSEAIRRTADAYRRTRLTPRFRRWLERWFAWTR